MGRRARAALASLILCQCASSYGAEPDAARPADPAGDDGGGSDGGAASSSDAAPREGSVADVSAGGAAIFEDAFEDGCSGWELDDATGSSAMGRSGTSCKICPTLNEEMGIKRRIPALPGRYRIEVWLRSEESGAPSTWVIKTDLETVPGVTNGGPENVGAMTEGFELATLDLVGPAGLAAIEVSIGTESPKGKCMLVDDVRLVQLP